MDNKVSSDRLIKLLLVCVAAFAVLVGRMAWLQLYKGMYYGAQADGNRMRSVLLLAPRGRIYDCNGVVLADNTPAFVLNILPSRQVTEAEIRLLTQILSMKEEDVRARVAKAKTTYEPVAVKTELNMKEVTLLEENAKDLPNVALASQAVRRYPYPGLAAHVLGYVGEVSEAQMSEGRYKGMPPGSIVGKDGLEWVYDKDLRGTNGRRTEEVDVRGRVVQQLAGQAPQPGQDLVLTLDYRLQKTLEDALDHHLRELGLQAAAAVALDPGTGAVKALASRPGFDPNWFVGGISSQHWNSINDNPHHPLNNKVIDGEYPAGSTFKVVTGSAGLEEHKVSPDELIYDSGRHWLIDMRNAGGEALGWLNFQTAFAKSDNVYFYEVGRRVGIDTLDAYARRYGFGQRTGLGLPGEAAGVVASPAVKQKLLKEDWYLGDTFNTAIGQGLTLVTPIQLAQMLASVADGGVLRPPFLIDRILRPDGSTASVLPRPQERSLGISADTIRRVQDGLKGVTQEGGTAAWFSGLPVDIAGKTGTAENPHGRDHSWFIAYAPADKPSLVLVCIVEQGGYGSTASAPIIYEVLNNYLLGYPNLQPEAQDGNKPAGAAAAR
ncbi:MAG: penicillin-binding protein 2 [Selenomonadales bacterium]|jgi:penicillin-binding protein 2|nr:penicillin-binding protein 2 [Selenomonadales bacterium]